MGARKNVCVSLTRALSFLCPFTSQRLLRRLPVESKLEGQGGILLTMHVFLFTMRSRVGLNISLLVYLDF